MGFIGENAKGKLLERSFPLDTLQELSKRYIYQCFLKVFGILKPFFQKGFKPPETALPLLDKSKFKILFSSDISEREHHAGQVGKASEIFLGGELLRHPHQDLHAHVGGRPATGRGNLGFHKSVLSS